MSVERPVFVIGTPRSGTTLTAKILGRHSQLFMPGETHFFPAIYSLRQKLGDPPGENGGAAVYAQLSDLYERYWEPEDQKRVDKLLRDAECRQGLEAACRSGYQPALDYFMEMQMREEGKNRWGNNAPRDLFHVEEIHGFYPDACFVICVRDIRDFLFSYQGKWKVVPEQYVERLQKLYHPVVTAMLWKASMRKVLKLKTFLPPKQRIIIRYEDLVSEPEKTVREICDLAGLDFEPGMLEVDSHNSSEVFEAKGIFTSSIGRWRNKLQPEEVSVAQRLARQEMNDLGYHVEPVAADFFKVCSIYLTTPYKLYQALKANSEMTGPLLPYIIKRMRSLF